MPKSSVRARRGRLGFALLLSALMSVSIIAIGAGTAQAATPTLTLSASATAVTVTGTPQAGGVNIVTNSTGLKEPGILLFKLKAGASESELMASLEQEGRPEWGGQVRLDHVRQRSAQRQGR